MKAVVYTRYGSPDVLRFTDVERPAPKDNEVLVKVHAVSLNASDWEVLRGKPLYSRIAGPFRPRHHILGSDIAGRVAARRCSSLRRESRRHRDHEYPHRRQGHRHGATTDDRHSFSLSAVGTKRPPRPTESPVDPACRKGSVS
jgi:hypothetical protein